MDKYAVVSKLRFRAEMCEEFGELWEENDIICHGVSDNKLIISVGGVYQGYRSTQSPPLAPATLEKYFRERARQFGAESALQWLKSQKVMAMRINQEDTHARVQAAAKLAADKVREKFVENAYDTKPFVEKGNPAKDNKAFNKEHNQKAYNETKSALKRTGSAFLYQATGTGKSSVFTALMDDYSDIPCMFLCPQSGIESQFIGHQKKNKVKKNGNLHTNLYQGILADYKNGFPKMKEEFGDKKVGLLCLDEVHRTGADEWGKALEAFVAEFCDGNTKVVAGTATPERADGKKIFMQNAVHTSNLSLEEAIVDGILPMPSYWNIPQFNQKDVDNAVNKAIGKSVLTALQLKWVVNETDKVMEPFTKFKDERYKMFREKLNAIGSKSFENGKGMKILGFAADIKDAEEGTGEIIFDQVKKAFPGKKVIIHAVHSKSPKVDKEWAEGFKEKDVPENEIHILMAVDMFNEGIHADGVDTVIMGRPTKSDIIYSQQIGRVLDVSDDKEANVFDMANNSQDSKHQWKDIEQHYIRAGEKRGHKEVEVDHQYEDALKECGYVVKSLGRENQFYYGVVDGHWRSLEERLDEMGIGEAYKKSYRHRMKVMIKDKGMSFEKAWKNL